MEQATATEESIYQLSAATEQDIINPNESWHQMVQTFINQEVELDVNAEPATKPQIAGPQAQEHKGLDSPSVKGHYSLSILINVGFEAGLSGNTIHPISRVVDLSLGKNRSETICRLRILAFFSLFFHAIVGVPFLFGNFYSVHATYLVMLITTVGAIVVALVSLFVSYWPVSDPSSDERSNWITGLLIANLFLLGSRRAVYWTLTSETFN